MDIAYSTGAIDKLLSAPRTTGKRIALVPTMGNLHAGHLALMERAGREAEVVVASIFVNPLQFGAGEDFEAYPRTLDTDLEKLRTAGVDAVFAPSVADMYPQGYPPTVCIEPDGDTVNCLEGAFRPGHFKGVATVVGALFNRVQPDVAVFGEKDWQQLQVVRCMVAELGFKLDVIGEPVVRDVDGLALSSRNRYLSAEERRIAPGLHAALVVLAAKLQAGERNFSWLSQQYVEQLRRSGFQPQYLEIRRPDLSAAKAEDHVFQILAAAWLGKTRLIDNLQVAGC